MNKIQLTLLLGLMVAGCTSVSPNYDAKFGESVRAALLKQTINPEAGKIQNDAAGMDGKAARETILLYQGTFKEPPAVVNVINIGGGSGAK